MAKINKTNKTKEIKKGMRSEAQNKGKKTNNKQKRTKAKTSGNSEMIQCAVQLPEPENHSSASNAKRSLYNRLRDTILKIFKR